MAGFRVGEGALERAATRLEGLASQVAPARTYADSHLTMHVDDTGALGSWLRWTLEDITEGVPEVLATLNTHLAAAAVEIRESARLYRQTDDAVDASLDASY